MTGRKVALSTVKKFGALLDFAPRRVHFVGKSTAATLHGDWERIGGDLRRAMTQVRGEVSTKKG